MESRIEWTEVMGQVALRFEIGGTKYGLPIKGDLLRILAESLSTLDPTGLSSLLAQAESICSLARLAMELKREGFRPMPPQITINGHKYKLVE